MPQLTSAKPATRLGKPAKSQLKEFDVLPESAGIPIALWVTLSGRSRSSIYRDIERGVLSPFKIGGSVRLRVAECRQLLRGV